MAAIPEGKGPAFTTTLSLLAGTPGAEQFVDADAFFSDVKDLAITGFLAEGDGANDFEWGYKDQIGGAATFFLVPAVNRVVSQNTPNLKKIFFRSPLNAVAVKILVFFQQSPAYQTPSS